MSAGTYNIIIEQGAYYTRTFNLADRYGSPYDLSNVTSARGQIRRHAAQKEPAAILDVTIVDAALGRFTVELDSETTMKIPAYDHVYDVEFVFDDGDPNDSSDDSSASPRVHRMLQGKVKVSANVTR